MVTLEQETFTEKELKDKGFVKVDGNKLYMVKENDNEFIAYTQIDDGKYVLHVKKGII